jgi:catechol 2,3-dioxygenase-like lactoylglutathione lyase family enzyme
VIPLTGERVISLAKVDEFSSVGIFVSDHKKARDFYTKKLGLKVVGGMAGWEYVELGVSKTGKDAVLNLWTPKAWGLSAKEAKKRVGVITGVGFRTANLAKTVESLRRKGVKVETWDEPSGESMATVYDPDGNALFITGPKRSRSKKAGIEALEFVTISSRNSRRTGAFFQKALGMRKSGTGFAYYRVGGKGTALMPFTPRKAMYEDLASYKSDMAAIGEDTAIMMSTNDIYGLEKKLLGQGVKFRSRAKVQDWGGISAEFYDPDKNVYMLYQSEDR